MPRVSVLHLIDTLRPGGAERVAVNLAGSMPLEHYQVHLGTTRFEGPLASQVAPHVARLKLPRRRRLDWAAVRHLASYLREHRIRIIHAHGTAVFLGKAAAMLSPGAAVLWHNHYGRYAIEDQSAWHYRLLCRRIDGAIVVNEPLAEWSRRRLRMPSERVWHIPNFVLPVAAPADPTPLPGGPGKRIVCVANVRPEKDILTLVRAMQRVVRGEPEAHLVIAGSTDHQDYCREVRTALEAFQLERHVTLLGVRQDVPAVLQGCDVAVLASAIEGMPLALVEYGMAGLPTVATDVGQCGDVLAGGGAGVLVPPRAPAPLADALLALLRSTARRQQLGACFRRRVEAEYSPASLIARVCEVYRTVGWRRGFAAPPGTMPSDMASPHIA